MTKSLAYSFITTLAAVSLAAPNPAVNRIDAPVHRPHSTSVSLEIASSSSIAPGITLKPREPAVNRIDAVGVNVHNNPTSSATHSYSFRTLVSTTLGPHIALNPRDPAVNRIDAVGVKANPKTTTQSTTTESTVSGSSSSTKPYITLNPRDPAVNRIDAPAHKPHPTTLTTSAAATSSALKPHAPVEQRAPAINRIDAVGNGAVDEALFGVDGGTPVTLAISDIRQLEAAATEIIAAPAVPLPAVSVIPSPDNTAIPASLFAAPPPSSDAIPVQIPNTQTVLYITLLPSHPIPQLDMSQTLLHALSALHQTVKDQNGQDAWLPTDDWSWFDQQWDCLLTAENNLIPGPGGRAQRLTYGILHSALVGLWGEMYAKGRFFGCGFVIWDARWGVVGSGSMSSWKGSLGTE